LIDFWTDFFTILARLGWPSCGHVGDIFGNIGEAMWGAPGFDVVLLYFVEFWRVWGRFWTVRNRFWIDFGLIFGRFWAYVGRFCGDF